MNHTQLIQHLIDKNHYRSYLEIGLGDGDNFERVRCRRKFGVDINPPYKDSNFFACTSDDYFIHNNPEHKFDIIFVDGLHEYEQVLRDVKNSLYCLRVAGTIIVHDINPPCYESTLWPRRTKQWCGDVYRAWYQIVVNNPGICTTYLDDYGTGIIEPVAQKLELKPVHSLLNYNAYKEWLEKQSIQ